MHPEASRSVEIAGHDAYMVDSPPTSRVLTHVTGDPQHEFSARQKELSQMMSWTSAQSKA
jgi:hypothetical protein